MKKNYLKKFSGFLIATNILLVNIFSVAFAESNETIFVREQVQGMNVNPIASAKILTTPKKIRYQEYEHIDPIGLCVEVHYNDGSFEYVEYNDMNQSDWVFIPHTATSLTVDDSNVIVLYKNYELNYKIIVTRSQNNYNNLLNPNAALGLVSKGVIYKGQFTESVNANSGTEVVTLQYPMAPATPIIPRENVVLAIMKKPPVILGNYSITDDGNIIDRSGNVVGNLNQGDRVNVDGSFIHADGTIEYPDGRKLDRQGNIHNLDGSTTTTSGLTYFRNGDIKDATNTIYHLDGTVTYANGDTMDSHGVIHFADGSIKRLDGTIFRADGSIQYPNGTVIDKEGQLVASNKYQEMSGDWIYDPATDSWKFIGRENGQVVNYIDRWIYTKNAKGNLSWYMVDGLGEMVTGWVRRDNKIYYFSKDADNRGEMLVGTVEIDGKYYKFDENIGALERGTVPLSVLK